MILIDSRAGSAPRTVNRLIHGRSVKKDYKGLLDYPPLNSCLDCDQVFHWSNSEWICSSGNFRHSPLSSLCQLPSADVSFTGQGPSGPLLIGIEVKSLSDLISSFQSQRLQGTQIPSMQRDYDVHWLLYYSPPLRCNSDGLLEVINRSSWKLVTMTGSSEGKPVYYSYLKKALYELALLGTPYEHVYDMQECAQWIYCAYDWWQTPWNKHKLMKAFDSSQDLDIATFKRLQAGIDPQSSIISPTSSFPLPSSQSRLYQRAKTAKSLPGMGYERAMAAGKHFSSIRQMINAEVDEWQRVDGIGKTLARSIVEYVTEEEDIEHTKEDTLSKTSSSRTKSGSSSRRRTRDRSFFLGEE